MKVLGIDLSLTMTGLAAITVEGFWREATTGTIDPGKRKAHERLDFILEKVRWAALGTDLIVMEGVSYGSFDKEKALAGAWWIVKHALHESGHRVATIPPSTLKQYATGKGNALKREVMAAVEGWGFKPRDDNEADALALASAGLRWLGEPIEKVPVAQQDALLKARWPEGNA